MSASPQPAVGTVTRRSRTSWVSFLFLAAVVALFWGFDGWLLARLRVIANDTFANGSPENPLLFIDGRDELLTYSPKRLGRFSNVPSSQVRTVVCLSLAERRNEVDPALWKGVVPKLIRLHSDDADPMVRDCARTTLFNLPCIPAEDVEAVLSFVERPMLLDDSLRQLNARLLENVHAKHPEQWPRIAAVYLHWLKSPQIRDRGVAFQQMCSLEPKAPETLAVFRQMMDADDPDGITSGHGRTMLGQNPELIDESMNGNDAQRLLVLSVAEEDVRWAAEVASAIKYNRPIPNFGKSILTKSHLDRSENLAASSLNPNAPLKLVQNACGFLSYRPNGAAILFEGARKMRGKSRASAIRSLQSALSSTPGDAAKYLDDILSWVRDDNPDVQVAAIQYLRGYGNPQWLAAQRKDPKSSVVEACRWMLDHHPGREDDSCLTIIRDASQSLSDADADRIADAIRRLYQSLEREHKEKGYDKSGVKLYDRYQDIVLTFAPRHLVRPAVKQLLDYRAQLEQRKVFGVLPKPIIPGSPSPLK